MVTADRAAQEQARCRPRRTGRRRAPICGRHSAYLEPAPPRLVAVGGLSGTGKTTLAAALAPELGSAPGAVHVRSDLERKRLFGVEETVRLPAQSYTPQASAEVYAIVLRKARLALAAGQSVIADAVYSTPEERSAIEALAARARRALPGPLADRRPARRWSHASMRAGATPPMPPRRWSGSSSTWQLGALSPAWTTLDAGGPAQDVHRRAASALVARQLASTVAARQVGTALIDSLPSPSAFSEIYRTPQELQIRLIVNVGGDSRG